MERLGGEGRLEEKEVWYVAFGCIKQARQLTVNVLPWEAVTSFHLSYKRQVKITPTLCVCVHIGS